MIKTQGNTWPKFKVRTLRPILVEHRVKYGRVDSKPNPCLPQSGSKSWGDKRGRRETWGHYRALLYFTLLYSNLLYSTYFFTLILIFSSFFFLHFNSLFYKIFLSCVFYFVLHCTTLYFILLFYTLLSVSLI